MSVADRIGSFVSDPNAGTLTGDRRMGTVPLLDMLADHIEKDDSMNVIRVMRKEDIMEHIASGIVPGKKNHVILYADVDVKDTERIIKMFPDIPVYRAKELCHQVPVCFKEPAAGSDAHNSRCTR